MQTVLWTVRQCNMCQAEKQAHPATCSHGCIVRETAHFYRRMQARAKLNPSVDMNFHVLVYIPVVTTSGRLSLLYIYCMRPVQSTGLLSMDTGSMCWPTQAVHRLMTCHPNTSYMSSVVGVVTVFCTSIVTTMNTTSCPLLVLLSSCQKLRHFG